MEPDPLQFFDQQWRSEDLINEHRDHLVDEARAVLANMPDARIACLIAEPGTREHDAIWRATAGDLDQPAPKAALTAIVPRHQVEPTLARPECGDLQARVPVDLEQLLPIVVCTRDGMRVGYVSL